MTTKWCVGRGRCYAARRRGRVFAGEYREAQRELRRRRATRKRRRGWA